MNNDEILNKIYFAIVRHARKGSLITFGNLARECGLIWPDDRYNLYSYLDKLMDISAERDWPVVSVIVVKRGDLESGKIGGTTLDGLITAAKNSGYPIGDRDNFVEEQMRRTFEWALTAPDNLTSE